jgi:hypothetical protein
MGVSRRWGVHVAICFPMISHAQFSQFAPYNNEVGTSIAGSNNNTIGIPGGLAAALPVKAEWGLERRGLGLASDLADSTNCAIAPESRANRK